ncbi:DHA2 family multidrug resistance protein [Luteibacter sp. Sphag1AF]|uniref:DHA2 family efflux MFS transporter permease subunit n=1 Tax=Luteibacter sp. Sphag1AF TaxID=2587031 RepID=UPI00161423F9|nr:DHA2 family efflux MFS transporter permease subunit [Luteibacter sp. Sphag1AF]MBB3226541.1 DHA2 family multidrug resistance protein [Luteibacter sp. Sphag1AF]
MSASSEDTVSLRTWVAVIGGAVGCFMAGMNVHVTNASLPDIRGSLGATFEEGSWISTAYLVAEIIVIPLSAWLASVFSMRRVLMTGTLGFVVFSILCSVAPNIGTMIFARTLQGAFGGVLIPLSFQLIVTELPRSKHALGMALFAVSNNVAQAAGPSLGGWLTDMYSWRYIFYLQIPPGLALLAAIGWSIRAKPLELARLKHGDWGGIAAMALGLSALQIMLEEGGRKDWLSSSFIVSAAMAAALGLVAFVWIELRRKEPFINLRLLGSYNFGLASLMQFLFGAVVFGVVFLVPNYFADVQGFNARDIGVVMIPYGVVQFIMSFATPPLMRRTSPRIAIVLGFSIMAVGCLMNMHLSQESAQNTIVPSLIVRGIGQSLIVVALGVMSIEGMSKSDLGSASGVFSMVRNVGGAIGIAIASQWVVEREKFHAMRIGEHVTPFAEAYRDRIVALVSRFAGHAVAPDDALQGAAFATLRQRALGQIQQVIHKQALLQAYSDVFLMAGVIMLVCAAGALLLRGPRKSIKSLDEKMETMGATTEVA